jgi:GNAT superfamily N-acetyltransferase
MVFAPQMRGRGLGPLFLRHCEGLAHARGCPRLYLAVLEENPKARAFWERQGFRPTGLSGHDDQTGHTLHRLEKTL